MERGPLANQQRCEKQTITTFVVGEKRKKCRLIFFVTQNILERQKSSHLALSFRVCAGQSSIPVSQIGCGEFL